MILHHSLQPGHREIALHRCPNLAGVMGIITNYNIIFTGPSFYYITELFSISYTYTRYFCTHVFITAKIEMNDSLLHCFSHAVLLNHFVREYFLGSPFSRWREENKEGGNYLVIFTHYYFSLDPLFQQQYWVLPIGTGHQNRAACWVIPLTPLPEQ